MYCTSLQGHVTPQWHNISFWCEMKSCSLGSALGDSKWPKYNYYNCPVQKANTDKSGLWDPGEKIFGSHIIRKCFSSSESMEVLLLSCKKYWAVAELQASQNWILM